MAEWDKEQPEKNVGTKAAVQSAMDKSNDGMRDAVTDETKIWDASRMRAAMKEAEYRKRGPTEAEKAALLAAAGKEAEQSNAATDGADKAALLAAAAEQAANSDEVTAVVKSEATQSEAIQAEVTDPDEAMLDESKSATTNSKAEPFSAKLLIKDIIIACLIALVISFFIRPTIVRETSMQPTVEPNDYLLMSKQAYTFGEIERGDIVIFESELKLDETHNKLLIKRVIALPGDSIEIKDNQVFVNSELLDEPYIAEGGTPGDVSKRTLDADEVWVMGDHRAVSIDSRSLGAIKEDAIVGKAIFRLYPFSGFGRLK